MKENVKYQDSRVTFGRGGRAVAWCLGCFCLFFLALPRFAFSAAIVVRGNLNLGGDVVIVDSFDSTDPTKSTNGQYDPTKPGDHGDIYAGFTIQQLFYPSTVAIGNSQVYGTLTTSPTNPYTGPISTVSLGPNGAIGTHAWQTNGGIGIEPGFYLNTNLVLTDVAVPAGLQFITPAPGQVVLYGPPISQTFTAQTNLPTLATNQSFTSVTTNFSTVTTAIYPGPVPGLTTNITETTVTSYPGDVPGLETNCVSFVTVSNDPGPQMCLITNQVATVTTPDYPGPIDGLVTNEIISPCIEPITNFVCSDPIDSPTVPESWCASSGIITNYTPSHTKIIGYTYTTNTSDEIVTYSTNYDCASSTNYTYSYPIYDYTYADLFSYSYPVLTYSYPQVTSYDYTLYTAWTYVTNSYDAVLSNRCYFATSLGNTIVTGPSTLVLASNFPIANLTIVPEGSLTVFVESGSCNFNSSSILNATGVASNLQILCAPSVSSVTLGGNANFIGILDAPQANVTVNVVGHVGIDFSGTLIANSLSVSGNLRMHYDESLGQLGYLEFPAYPMSPILAANVSSNGQFQLYVEIQSPGDKCAVETSTDLMNWVPVFTNTDGNNYFEYTDTNGTSAGQCFYRTIYVQ